MKKLGSIVWDEKVHHRQTYANVGLMDNYIILKSLNIVK